MVTATQTLVLIDHETRTPVRVPDAVRDAIGGFEPTPLDV
jgi:acyl-CoA thioesterase FadM